jgi:AcrR family transcriptional regulator
VDAAIRLLDADGLDAFSMRRVADELGTGAASLYWHVGSKDGLFDLVFDKIIGEGTIPDPVPGKWREQLKEVARAQRAISLQHPYIVRISFGRIPMGPNALRYSERVLAILRAGGLPPKLAVQGSHLLISTVNGFTLDETGVGDEVPRSDPGASPAGASPAGSSPAGASPGSTTPGSTDAAGKNPQDDRDAIKAEMQQMAAMARDYLASLPPAQFPNLIALADEFSYADRDEQFELLIDIFVDGLARVAGEPEPT